MSVIEDYTANEKNMLNRVNEIGMQIDELPEKNLVFIALSPYLDELMRLLKRLQPIEIQTLFVQYKGVMRVMRMIEDSAQQMEKELKRD